MQWNTLNSGGGLAFPLQNLMAALGPTTPINEWIYQKEGATIDTPTNLEAAKHLEQWIQAGYFPEDVNAIEYADSNSRFGKGEGVFTFNGDWQNGGYDKDAPGKVGFFLFPSAEDGGVHGSMGVPTTFGIAANAKHADCAAFFLELGGDRSGRSPDHRDRRGLEPGRSVRPAPSGCPGRFRHDRDAPGLTAGRRGERRDGLHRQRDRDDLHGPQRLDDGAPEDGRRSADG